MSEECGEFNHKYVDPRQLLGAWTADHYQNYPMYLNITQVGSMAEITIRTPEAKDQQQQTITFTVNYWTLSKLAQIFKEAASAKKIEADGVCEKCGNEHHTPY